MAQRKTWVYLGLDGLALLWLGLVSSPKWWSGAGMKGDVAACQLHLRNLALSLGTLVDNQSDGRWPDQEAVGSFLRHEEKNEAMADGSGESYAIRDTARFPIEPGQEDVAVLAADANQAGPNHAGAINVVFMSGRVETWLGADLAPYVDRTAGYVIVGPGSMHPELAKLVTP